jgi:hypothetical protein
MKKFITLLFVFILSACSDNSTIYENTFELQDPDKIKLNEVKIVAETDSSLTVEFSYTYNHSVPANEIKLFVMPDHGYWNTKDVKIIQGTHTATAIIGLSKNNMAKKNVTESDTTKLRFRFDRYQPQKYLGNVWGEDIPYDKHWKLP